MVRELTKGQESSVGETDLKTNGCKKIKGGKTQKCYRDGRRQPPEPF